MTPETDVYWTARPALPWLIVGLVAVILIAITILTYLVHGQNRPTRLFMLLGLRILALLLALIVIVRPSLAIIEEPNVPSRVIVAVDVSESMTIQDEFNDQSRWQVVRAALRESESVIEELRDENNIRVDLHMFAEGLREYDPDIIPDGTSTNFAGMLDALFDQYQMETDPLRGLLVLSDGADNGPEPALPKAANWQSLCPIHGFAVGKTTTSSDIKDIVVRSLTADPTPVPIKGELILRALVDAPGFPGARVRATVSFDDVSQKTEMVELPKVEGNLVTLTVDAPSEPGEIKLSLNLEPLPGEITKENNFIETYVTVTKEGVSVLAVDRLRLEMKYLRYALSKEKRIRFYEVNRQTDEVPGVGARSLYGFDRQFYDVIVLGDVSARRLAAGSPGILSEVARLVKEEGVGLMMMGGTDSFGGTPGVSGSGDWEGTPIADILPVRVDAAGQVDQPTTLYPTEKGQLHYLMRLHPDRAESDVLWQRLNDPTNRTLLQGRNQLGRVKEGATVLARADDPVNGPPVLVGWDVGKGRVLAFAGDSTRNWIQLGIPTQLGEPVTQEGRELHERFWKQTVLWLAQQEEQDGNAYIRPEVRRLPVRGKQTLMMGLRGKAGNELKPDQLDYQIIKPGGERDPSAWQKPSLDAEGKPRVLYEPLQAGEYVALVRAAGEDTDGARIEDEDSARFIVYPDISGEMIRKAADHDFLRKLQSASNPGAGPELLRAEELPDFLRALKNQPLLTVKPKPEFVPDWRRDASWSFLPSVLVLFVLLLGLEWGFRRSWGMA